MIGIKKKIYDRLCMNIKYHGTTKNNKIKIPYYHNGWVGTE